LTNGDFQPPLVGREREIEFLQKLLEETFAGRGTLVLIAGEAGIGKTRIADEFQKLAAQKGCQVMVGRCVPGALSPYLPFQDALERYFGAKSGVKTSRYQRIVESARRAAPELVESTPIVGGILKATAAFYKEYREIDLNPESESERTLHASLEFLRKMSVKQPVLMVLDDLQWADSASLQLLHFLARNSNVLRILLIGTYRPEDLQVEEGGKVHPLIESLRIMRREGIFHELALDRLAPDELKLALEGMLGGKIDAELLHKIASESGGNPLFAVEVVRLLVSTKSIVFRDGVWKISGHVRIDVPSTVKEVILRRIDRLPRDERRLLECAAVVGEWFDPSVLEKTLGLNRLNLLEDLDTIERNFQLLKASDGLYRFNHEKIRQVTYDEISLARRKELHRIIGQVLEGRLPDESLYTELSVHFCGAGETNKCITYSLLAGQSCIKRFATIEAIPYFQRVIEGAKDEPPLMEDKLQALEGLGDANKTTGLYDLALSFYDKFLELCRSPRDIVRVLRKSAEIWHPTVKSNPSKAVDLLNQAEGYGDVETVETGRIKWLRGSLATYLGAFGEAERFYSEAEKLFEQCGATEDLAMLLLEYSELYVSQGLAEEALEKAKRADQLFSGVQSLRGEHSASLMLGDIYFHLGLVKEALESYARSIEIAAKFGRYTGLFWAHLYRGLVYYSVDDFESARLEAVKAHEYSLKTESLYHRALVAVLASCEIRLNRIVEGEKLCLDALEALKSIPTDIRSPLRGIVILATAELHAAKKEWAASNENFRQCIEWFPGVVYGILYEAMARTRFGEALLKQGLNSQAKEQFTKTVQLYEKLGNVTQAQRVKKLVAEQA